MELGVAGHGAPRVGCARQLLQEALVMMWLAARGSSEALAVPALELQHQPGVGVEGGDRRYHATGKGDPGRARDTHTKWESKMFSHGFERKISRSLPTSQLGNVS